MSDHPTVMKLFAVCLRSESGVGGRTVVDDAWIEFFMAEDAEHAVEQALDSDDVEVVCVAHVPDPKTPDATIRSNGHLAFVPDTHGGMWEYYLFSGDIYRQTTAAPVMPDGRRAGRWYSKGTQQNIDHLMSISVNPSAPARV
jgi:hypothetical protein